MALSDLVDVVDDDDNVTSSATIGAVRKEGLVHRLARVMVEDTEGKKILLQKRNTKLLWPDCWDNSAARHVDVGEDYLTAAKRELFEEIGIDAAELEEIGKYFSDSNYKDSKLRRFNMVYRYRTVMTPTNLQADEVSEVKWFTVDEIKDLIKDHPDKVTDGLTDVIGRYY